jgi:hypothetical protein
MNTITKPMSAPILLGQLSADLLVDEYLLLETIKEDEDLLRVTRSYFAGDFTYSQVLDTIKDYF